VSTWPSHPIRLVAPLQAEPPETVFQTIIEGGRQDSSSLLPLSIALSGPVARALRAAAGPSPASDALARHVTGAIRRFDGAELGLFDEASESMQGLRLPPACFAYGLPSPGTLEVLVRSRWTASGASAMMCCCALLCVVAAGGPLGVLQTDSLRWRGVSR
jgi:hypothetical protein